MKRSSDGEVFGTRLLNGIVFLGAVAILIASLFGPSVQIASNPAQHSIVTGEQS